MDRTLPGRPTGAAVVTAKDGWLFRATPVERPLYSDAEWAVAQLIDTIDRLEKELERLRLKVEYNHRLSDQEYELIHGTLWQQVSKHHVMAALDNLADKYDKVGWQDFERDITSDFHAELEAMGYQFHAEAPCRCIPTPQGQHDARCGYVKKVRFNDAQKTGFRWPSCV